MLIKVNHFRMLMRVLHALLRANQLRHFGLCGARVDIGRTDRKECAAVILYTAETATQVALDAIQLLGGNG